MTDGFFDKFHIGTYCLSQNARDAEHVRELAECGIDLIFYVNNDRALLDLLKEHGVSAVVNGVLPGWFGGDGKNAGKMHEINTEESYALRAQAFTDHPAIIGIDVGDEPSSLDFPYYGRIVSRLSDIFPDKLLYLNLYPSYGMLADAGKEQAKIELGTDTYREYLESYCENVNLPYISIDHYPYSSDIESFISDLSVAAMTARKHSRYLMVVLQVNSKDKEIFLSENQLRLQAWCALAYGARTLSWACYQGGWWHNNVLDKDGNKTEQYNKLKTVNRELRALTETYCDYTLKRTSLLDRGEKLTTDHFGRISADQRLLIGEFIGNNGDHALFCTPQDPKAIATIVFEDEDILGFTYRSISDITYSIIGNGKISINSAPIFIYSK